MIRAVAPDDAAAIAAIYAHHVAHGTATFDLEAPDADWWRAKIAALTDQGAPFLVATQEDEPHAAVIGYAYAARFRDRLAYRFTCEDSIYVHPDHTGQGIGGALLSALIDAATSAGFRQMIAVIGGAEPASVALHAAQGFTEAGRMRSVGRKFGRWLDTLYMQRALGEGDTGNPPD